MATYTYKNFVLTDAAVDDETSEEWGPRENQLDEDIIDTIVGDCISELADTTGHKHSKTYNIYGKKVSDAETHPRIFTIGEVDSDEDEYGDSVAVKAKVGHFNEEAFVVEDSTTGEKPIVIDNVNREVEIGGNGYYISIGGTGGSDIDIGRIGNGNIISTRILNQAGTAFRILEGDNVIMLVDTLNKITSIGTGLNSNPLTIDSDGKVYTRDVFDVDHTIYGLSSITREVVELVTIGGQSYLHISIAGTKNGSDLFVSVPLSSAFDIQDGEVIGTTLGNNDGTEVVVGVKLYENIGIGGVDIRFIPIGGSPEVSGWSGGDPCSVSITIPFVLNDPEFTNEIPT
jgi:hypothetical protein